MSLKTHNNLLLSARYTRGTPGCAARPKAKRYGTFMRTLVILISLCVSVGLNASPCDKLDLSLSKEDAASFSPNISKQLNVVSTEVLYSIKSANWRVLYVQPQDLEPAFLFYSGSPAKNKYVELWAGVALSEEISEIQSWVASHVKGIPEPLANCFAWHVTEGRRGF